MNDWIDVNDRLPELKDDFTTMLEHQMISERVMIKLKPPIWDKKTDSDEIEAYHVNLNGKKSWSLDECGTSQYYSLEIAIKWKHIER